MTAVEVRHERRFFLALFPAARQRSLAQILAVLLEERLGSAFGFAARPESDAALLCPARVHRVLGVKRAKPVATPLLPSVGVLPPLCLRLDQKPLVLLLRLLSAGDFGRRDARTLGRSASSRTSQLLFTRVSTVRETRLCGVNRHRETSSVPGFFSRRRRLSEEFHEALLDPSSLARKLTQARIGCDRRGFHRNAFGLVR